MKKGNVAYSQTLNHASARGNTVQSILIRDFEHSATYELLFDFRGLFANYQVKWLTISILVSEGENQRGGFGKLVLHEFLATLVLHCQLCLKNIPD